MSVLFKIGQRINGVDYPAGILVIGGSSRFENKAKENNAAVDGVNIGLVTQDPVSKKLYGADGNELSVSGGWNPADAVVDYIVSGLLVPSAGAIGAAALPAGVAYITGKRVTYDGGVLALTATSDNYVDIDRDGVVTVAAVAVAAGAPAKAVNSMRLGRVTTNATNVTARTIDAADSNGNWMGNYVGKPYCRVVNASLVNYPSGRDGALPFGAATTRYDNTGMHSEAVNTSRFVAPRSGLYRFSGFVNVPNTAAVQNVTVKPFVDGAAASLGNRTFQVPDVQTLMVEGSVQLRAGQYMELWLQNPTSALDVSSCGFTMEWVG